MNNSKRQFFHKKKKRSFPGSLSLRSRDKIEYKNVSFLYKFISQQGKILSRKVTKLTFKQQRLITIAIKIARTLCFLPFTINGKQFEKEQLLVFRKKKPNLRRLRFQKTRFQTRKKLNRKKWAYYTPSINNSKLHFNRNSTSD